MHTPGPWKAVWWIEDQKADIGSWNFYDTNGSPIKFRRCSPNNETGEANARLIAACPTMYDYILARAGAGDARAAAIVESIRDKTKKGLFEVISAPKRRPPK